MALTPSTLFTIEIEIVQSNTGKLDRLLFIGPLYLAIQDL
jgi:hypothetical protein